VPSTVTQAKSEPDCGAGCIIRLPQPSTAAMPRPSDTYGFHGPLARPAASLPRLVATLALAAGTVIAATAVSIGIVRADGTESLMADRFVIDRLADHTDGVLELAVLLGALFLAACVSVALASRRSARRPAPSDHVSRHPPLF